MGYSEEYLKYVSPENSIHHYFSHVNGLFFEIYNYETETKNRDDLREHFCKLARTLSDFYFYKLTQFYFHGNDMDERGLTDLLIHEFSRLASLNRNSPVEIYKSKYESIYGSDIDLYYSPDGLRYLRFALQAKTLSPNGYYKHLTQIEGLRQIALLKAHQSKFGSVALYLSYCGYPDEDIRVNLAGATKTNGSHKAFLTVEKSKSDYGLGLNSITEVETLVNTLSKPNSTVHFFQLINKMQGLHRLLCPNGPSEKKDWDKLIDFDNKDLKIYSKDEIFAGTHYEKIGKKRKEETKEYKVVDMDDNEVGVVMSENSKYRIVFNAKKSD